MKTAPFAARQHAESDALTCRVDFPGWAGGPRVSNLPIRRMRRRSKTNSDGYQRSHKHPLADAHMIEVDSDAELDFLVFAELDPTVTFVTSQPTNLTFVDGGAIASHIPDFALIRHGLPEFHEVKGSRKAAEPGVRERLRAAAIHVENWTPWTYHVATTEALARHPLRADVNALWRHVRRCYTDMQLRGVLDTLHGRDRTIADVVAILGSGSNSPTQRDVLSMAAGCRILIDMGSGIGPHTVVRFPDVSAMPDSILPSVRILENPAWL